MWVFSIPLLDCPVKQANPASNDDTGTAMLAAQFYGLTTL